MSETVRESKPQATDETRRAALRRLGKFAAVTPPAVTLLLAAKKSVAATSIPTSSRQLKISLGRLDAGSVAAIVAAGSTADFIDGVGACLATIQVLAARIDCLRRAID
jgi:hypothetical protein